MKNKMMEQYRIIRLTKDKTIRNESLETLKHLIREYEQKIIRT